MGAMQTLSALIAEIEAEAYARGQSDARKELLDILGAGERAAPAGASRGRPGAGAAPKRRAGGSKRAPRGLAPRFVEQALRDHPGSAVQEILALAATDAERLIRLSSIRTELRNGRKQGTYELRDGRWSLAAPASAAAGEDGSSGVPPDVEPERDDAAGAPTGEPAMQDPASPEDAPTGEPAMHDPASPEDAPTGEPAMHDPASPEDATGASAGEPAMEDPASPEDATGAPTGEPAMEDPASLEPKPTETGTAAGSA